MYNRRQSLHTVLSVRKSPDSPRVKPVRNMAGGGATTDGALSDGAKGTRKRIRFADWVFTIVFLAGGTLALEYFGVPRVIPIDLSAPEFSRDLDGEIVPSYALGLLALLLPGATFCVFEFALLRAPRRFFATLSAFFLGICESAGITLVLTNALKLIVGRPRPFFKKVCVSIADPATGICSGEARAVSDARKSFPSGHSSLAFAVFVYLALYMGARMHIAAPDTRFKSAKLTALSMPVFIASLVAVSRIIDNHHNYSDIIAGSALGAAIAVAIWYARMADIEHARSDRSDPETALPLAANSHEIPPYGIAAA